MTQAQKLVQELAQMMETASTFTAALPDMAALPKEYRKAANCKSKQMHSLWLKLTEATQILGAVREPCVKCKAPGSRMELMER